MPPRDPLMAISVAVITSTPEERSIGFGVTGGQEQPVHGGCGFVCGGFGAMGPCQSKCTNPNRCPGWLGSRSGTICVASWDTVPVPYFTITPFVGSRVSRSISTPGAVLSVFGNVTATGWLAVVLAGWNATMKAPTP